MRAIIALIISFLMIYSWTVSVWFIFLIPFFVIMLTLLVDNESRN